MPELRFKEWEHRRVERVVMTLTAVPLILHSCGFYLSQTIRGTDKDRRFLHYREGFYAPHVI